MWSGLPTQKQVDPGPGKGYPSRRAKPSILYINFDEECVVFGGTFVFENWAPYSVCLCHMTSFFLLVLSLPPPQPIFFPLVTE